MQNEQFIHNLFQIAIQFFLQLEVVNRIIDIIIECHGKNNYRWQIISARDKTTFCTMNKRLLLVIRLHFNQGTST